MPQPWDAFLSYASEDREAVAGPLAELLTSLGARVWFDQTELKVGDSLRQRIDDGLAQSSFGIVLLSPAFFGKHYPERELNGLAQREIEGRKVILPVWIGVTDSDVRKYSPPLADRVALRWQSGLAEVSLRLFETICPELHATAKAAAEKMQDLAEIESGREFFSLHDGAHAGQHFHDEPLTEEDAELVGGLLSQAREVSDFAEDLDPTEQLKWQIRLTKEIGDLRAHGWQLFGGRSRHRMKVGKDRTDWVVAQLAILRAPVKGVAVLPDGQLVVGRGSSYGREPTERGSPV